MVDLMQATEFIKVGKDRYINKLGNGEVYSQEELKAMLRKNNEELNKKVVKEEANGIKPEATKTNRRNKSSKRTRN